MTSVLLDTNVLLWALNAPERLGDANARLLASRSNLVCFSPVSIWEIAIKASLGRPDFMIDAELVYQEALDLGFRELPLTGTVAVKVTSLPFHHRDPFDRLLVAQAIASKLELMTSNHALAEYGSFIRLV
jgi:PIN domain nuclease of toxin-antitoxin system